MKRLGDMKSKLNGYSESYRTKRADGKNPITRLSTNSKTNEESSRVEARPLSQLADPHQWAPPPKRGDPPTAPPRTQVTQPQTVQPQYTVPQPVQQPVWDPNTQQWVYPVTVPPPQPLVTPGVAPPVYPAQPPYSSQPPAPVPYPSQLPAQTVPAPPPHPGQAPIAAQTNYSQPPPPPPPPHPVQAPIATQSPQPLTQPGQAPAYGQPAYQPQQMGLPPTSEGQLATEPLPDYGQTAGNYTPVLPGRPTQPITAQPVENAVTQQEAEKRHLPDPRSFAPPPKIGNPNPTYEEIPRNPEPQLPPRRPSEPTPKLPSRPQVQNSAQVEPSVLPPPRHEVDQVTSHLANASLENDLASQIADRRAHLRAANKPTPEGKKPPPKPPSLSKPKVASKPSNLRSSAPTGENRPAPPLPPSRTPPPLGPRPSTASRAHDELELETQWYTGPVNNLQLPKYLQNRNIQFYTHNDGGKSQLVVNVREPDLSVLMLTFSYPTNNPSDVIVDRKKGPAPQPPSYDELEEAQEQFGERVARWSEDQRGSRVGDGECWTLAAEAVNRAGAMPAQGYIFGATILKQVDNEVVSSAGPMMRGDIAQFTSAKFASRTGRSQSGPHHTAVITDVDNSIIHVVEQNVSGSAVQPGRYDLAEMTNGTIEIYRPMPKSWIQPL